MRCDPPRTLKLCPPNPVFFRVAVAALVTLLARDLTAQMPTVRHVRYSGALTPATRADDSDDVLRSFDVDVMLTPQETAFCVDEDRRRGVPWPDSYGRTGSEMPDGAVEPHLVYEYDAASYLIALPPLLVALPATIAIGTGWSSGDWHFMALESVSREGLQMWKLDASGRRGRRQTLIVDTPTGLLWEAEADVFMGQGDQFRLTVKRTGDTMLDAAVSERTLQTQAELLAVQAMLKRRPDGFQRDLSERQVEDVVERLDKIEALAAGTPWEPLSKWIADDLVQQIQRQSRAADNASRWIGAELPDFQLTVAGGTPLTRADLAGQVVVLHFWDYRDSPLTEPYGQTGYLEFLFHQKKSAGLRVIGISTNPDLLAADTRARGLRSMRKLAEFMNLTYPIGYDDGSLMKTLGDPRVSGGQLPLWVVVAPDGRIRHYHAGPYEVDTSRGLSQLESELQAVSDHRD